MRSAVTKESVTMKPLRIAALIAVMTTLPVIGSAQSRPASPKATQTKQLAIPAMMGVVKSVDATSMVITRSNAKGPEETFQLNSSTVRKGKLESGDVVSVRYQLEDGKKVATVVTVKSAPKKQAGKVGR
jgi:hypothetical protein